MLALDGACPPPCGDSSAPGRIPHLESLGTNNKAINKMKIKYLIRITALIALSSHAVGQGTPGQGTGKRPNILFLLGDDVVSRVFGCYGGKLAQTPVVDKLAAQGVLFENSFVTTSICGPSRACILAGQHQRTTGIKDFDTPFTKEAFAQTYPMLMKQAGYRVGFIGKWGIGAKPDKMKYPASQFHYWRGWPSQAGYWYDDNTLLLKYAGAHLQPTPTARHEADVFPDYLKEFLNGAKADQPWCFSVSFKSVHPPRAPYPTLLNRFSGAELPPLPATCKHEFFDKLPEHLKQTFNACNTKSGCKTWLDLWGEKGFREEEAKYLRSIETLDMTIGRLLSVLKEKGVDQNTIIVFFGDNGHFMGEKGMVGKWLMYEESLRVPTIMFDPRLPEGQRGKRLQPMVLSIDLAPTMLALANIPKPQAMQGESWLPLLTKPAMPWRKDWFYEHTHSPTPKEIAKSEGVRTERWKYIRWLDPKPHLEELFDLQNDPQELHDLAKDPAHQDQLRQLRARYQYWRTTLPDHAPDPDEYEGNPLDAAK